MTGDIKAMCWWLVVDESYELLVDGSVVIQRRPSLRAWIVFVALLTRNDMYRRRK
jgi:hypothetical protein